MSVKETSTCIFKGVAVYACPTCGKEEFRSLPFAEHTPGEWIVKTDSTCSRVGIEECFCADCNVAFQTREIETKPHNFGEWGITTPPTCCEEGVQKRICERCGARESKPVLQTDVHVFGESEIFRNSTCSEHGYRKRTCLTCEESIYLSLAMDAEEHHFGEGEIIVKQSCLFEGKIRYTCADCGEVKEQILPAKGHRMTIVGKNEVVCSCGYSETTVKKFGKIQQIFASEKGTLTIESLALANGEYHFDFCEMTDVLTNEYRKYYPGFFKAYLWKLEFAGKPYELTSKMTFSIPIDEELEDHRIKIAVLREGRFYYLENVRIKNGEILINGELLSGAEAIFLEKGERITMSVAIPIIVTAVTVVLAAGAICLILFRAGIFRKKSNGTDEPTLPVNPQE
ncbi:MAG: hypothetical protein IJA86_05625 [Clostridia bacterium]|nr:hypothetical protein [Clostridia bacterium]